MDFAIKLGETGETIHFSDVPMDNKQQYICRLYYIQEQIFKEFKIEVKDQLLYNKQGQELNPNMQLDQFNKEMLALSSTGKQEIKYFSVFVYNLKSEEKQLKFEELLSKFKAIDQQEIKSYQAQEFQKQLLNTNKDASPYVDFQQSFNVNELSSAQISQLGDRVIPLEQQHFENYQYVKQQNYLYLVKIKKLDKLMAQCENQCQSAEIILLIMIEFYKSSKEGLNESQLKLKNISEKSVKLNKIFDDGIQQLKCLKLHDKLQNADQKSLMDVYYAKDEMTNFRKQIKRQESALQQKVTDIASFYKQLKNKIKDVQKKEVEKLRSNKQDIMGNHESNISEDRVMIQSYFTSILEHYKEIRRNFDNYQGNIDIDQTLTYFQCLEEAKKDNFKEISQGYLSNLDSFYKDLLQLKKKSYNDISKLFKVMNTFKTELLDCTHNKKNCLENEMEKLEKDISYLRSPVQFKQVYTQLLSEIRRRKNFSYSLQVDLKKVLENESKNRTIWLKENGKCIPQHFIPQIKNSKIDINNFLTYDNDLVQLEELSYLYLFDEKSQRQQNDKSNKENINKQNHEKDKIIIQLQQEVEELNFIIRNTQMQYQNIESSQRLKGAKQQENLEVIIKRTADMNYKTFQQTLKQQKNDFMLLQEQFQQTSMKLKEMDNFKHENDIKIKKIEDMKKDIFKFKNDLKEKEEQNKILLKENEKFKEEHKNFVQSVHKKNSERENTLQTKLKQYQIDLQNKESSKEKAIKQFESLNKEIKQLQQQNSQFLKENDELQTKNNNLKKDLKENLNKIDNIEIVCKQKEKQYIKDNQQKEIQFNQMKTDLAKAKSSLTVVENKNEELMLNIKQYEQKIHQKQQELQNSQIQLSQLQLDENEKQISISTQFEDLQSQLNSARNELQQKETIILEKNHIVKQHKSEIENYLNKQNEIQNEMNIVQNSENHLQTQLENLETLLNQKEKEIQDLEEEKEKIKQIRQTEFKKLQGIIEEKQQQIIYIEQKQLKNEEIIIELNTDKAQLEEEVESLKTYQNTQQSIIELNKDLGERNSNLNEKVQNLQEELTETKGERDDFEQQYILIKEKVTKTKEKNYDFEQQNDQLLQQFTIITEQITQKEEIINTLKSELQNQEDQNKQNIQKIDELNQNCTLKESKIEEVNKILSNKEKEINELLKNQENIAKKNKDMESSINQFGMSLKENKNINNKYQQQILELEKEKDSLKEQIIQCKKHTEENKKENNILKVNLEDKEKEYQKVKDEIMVIKLNKKITEEKLQQLQNQVEEIQNKKLKDSETMTENQQELTTQNLELVQSIMVNPLSSTVFEQEVIENQQILSKLDFNKNYVSINTLIEGQNHIFMPVEKGIYAPILLSQMDNKYELDYTPLELQYQNLLNQFELVVVGKVKHVIQKQTKILIQIELIQILAAPDNGNKLIYIIE